MRRDKMIGLALAIILVGFAAAFCFRNEQTDLFGGPALKNPQALDQHIAGNDGPKPYAESHSNRHSGGRQKVGHSAAGVKLQGVEVGDHSRPDAGQQPLAGQNPAIDIPDFLRQKPVPGPGADFVREPSPPAPIPAWNTQVPIPQHNRNWVPVPPDSETRNVGQESMLRERMRMHEVRKGDTLSELAVRYLGSSARFMEIYEANRDILRSPDDLRVGMKIAIPERRSLERASNPRQPAASRQNPTSANGRYRYRSDPAMGSRTRGVSLERFDALNDGANRNGGYDYAWHGIAPKQPLSPGGRFLPARNSSFSAGAQPGNSLPSRKLTQSPPEDLPSPFDNPFFPEEN